jgi:hypothetical protein
MRYSIFLIFATIGLLLSSDSMAQSHNTTISISGGQFFNNPVSGSSPNNNFSSSSTEQTARFTPQIALKVEQRLFKHLSIGLILHATSAKIERTITTTTQVFNFPNPQTTVKSELIQQISSKMSGASLNFKGFFVANPEVDAYVGLSIGGMTNNETIESATNVNPNPNVFVTQDNNAFLSLFDFNVGMRYFLPNNLGVFAEIGSTSFTILKGATGQFGVIYSF